MGFDYEEKLKFFDNEIKKLGKEYFNVLLIWWWPVRNGYHEYSFLYLIRQFLTLTNCRDADITIQGQVQSSYFEWQNR